MRCAKCGLALLGYTTCQGCGHVNDNLDDGPSTAPLVGRWRRLADSWIKATNGMDDFDDCRIRAVVRANTYRECAYELEEWEKDKTP